MRHRRPEALQSSGDGPSSDGSLQACESSAAPGSQCTHPRPKVARRARHRTSTKPTCPAAVVGTRLGRFSLRRAHQSSSATAPAVQSWALATTPRPPRHRLLGHTPPRPGTGRIWVLRIPRHTHSIRGVGVATVACQCTGTHQSSQDVQLRYAAKAAAALSLQAHAARLHTGEVQTCRLSLLLVQTKLKNSVAPSFLTLWYQSQSQPSYTVPPHALIKTTVHSKLAKSGHLCKQRSLLNPCPAARNCDNRSSTQPHSGPHP